MASKKTTGFTPEDSLGFVLRLVVRNRKIRWASQRDSQENPIGLPDGSSGYG